MAISLLGHVGILDNRTQLSFSGRLYTFILLQQLQKYSYSRVTEHGVIFLNYSISRIYAISKAKSFLPVH